MHEPSVRDHDIAIIGMAGRFPGAANIAEFWENLKDGVESFTAFQDDELRAAHVDERLITHPNYVKVRPVLDDIRGFDAELFGYHPREAELADPQQRLFLECVWEALEHSGYGVRDSRGRVGLFAGMNISMYLHDRFVDPAVASRLDPHEVVVGNDKDALTTVVAHRLNLTGPAVSVQTFCSTSATAVHLACQSLRHGECELALAGGVCVRVPDRVGYLYVEGGMASPDGHIRTFDAKAQGSVFGDGVGVVVLKPLRQALADRDTIFAVVRGSAINNDGGSKFSYAAPSIIGQSTAVSAALADAEVAPHDISYIEAHGTATELGDPIEVAALSRAFRATERAMTGKALPQRQYCAIGSVKTNVGHLDRAASVTGLIKVVQALRHELIPKSLHYESPNPEIEFNRSPFYVAGDAVPWPRQPGRPRLAGVNGLGMGGTNVHIVVQEAPDAQPRTVSPRHWQVLTVSAQSSDASRAYADRLARHLDRHPDQDLGDVAYTLQQGRTVFPHRRACVASVPAEAARALAGQPTPPVDLLTRHDSFRGRPVAFLLAGVGEHYAGMVTNLYRTEPTFRRHLDEGQRLLAQHCGIDVAGPLTAPRGEMPEGMDLAALLSRKAPAAERGQLSQTLVAQPAVFLVEYALARTLMDWGVQPTVLLGYSVGEYVAACLAGVFSLDDGLRLVARRAELIDAMPEGALLAVGSSWPQLTARVPELGDLGVHLSAENPDQTVVGGPADAIQSLAARLRGEGIPCRSLDTTHAFHTPMLAPAMAALTAWVTEHITLRPPTRPFVSNVTGRLATAELVTNPSYWARHMCQPVRFAEGLAEVLGQRDVALLEIGAGRSLGVMARAHPDCARERWPLVVATLPAADEVVTDDRALATALAQLWLTGVTIDWDAYHAGLDGWLPGRVPVPTYPFQRKDYWFNEGWRGPAASTFGDPNPQTVASEYETLPLLPESRWLNASVWHQKALRSTALNAEDRWLVFVDAGDADLLGDALRARLDAWNQSVTVVRPGESFAEAEGCYLVRPGSGDDMCRLFATLKARRLLPNRVVHMWTLAPTDVTTTIRRGMHTVVALARAAHEIGFDRWHLDVVTAGTCQVTGADPIVAERATVLGPCTVLPMECPGTTLRVIDLPAGIAPPTADVLAELASGPANQTVALRGGRRWSPDFEVIEPERPSSESDAEPPIRNGGVYLITGGLGGIGLALAERLTTDYQARLVLLGRTPMPPSEQWEGILTDPDASEEVKRRVRGLQDLRARGVEFVVVAGDVAEPADVRHAVETALKRFGALHGVIHTAGVPGVGMMQFKSGDDMDAVLAPKVSGTLALAAALRDTPVDFVVLFSSVAAAAAALGQADYSAANAFMDAFAQGDALPQTRVLSIGWGEWTWNRWSAGLDGYEPAVREFYRQHRAKFGIDFDAGWRCLLRALSRPEPYLVVSTQDFAASVRDSHSYTIEDIQSAARRGRGGQRHPRPDLSTQYVAPRTAEETAVADIWAEALGLEHVGIFDNFFELGGSSFIGVGIVDAVRRRLELDHLPAHVIYQAPTVAALAAAATGTDAANELARAADVEARGARQRDMHLARRRAVALDAIGETPE